MIDDFRLRHDNGLLFIEFSMPLFSSGMESLAVGPLSDSELVIYGDRAVARESLVNEQGVFRLPVQEKARKIDKVPCYI